ncbi:ABC1 kinase family protein [Patulibacter minatonensis]|uniref:ABC1 kinase family protein n=1 Tax=Patulibacter minatonensis TaxID=298163 RepID=UPI000A0404D1|nr:AarF/UbiB family protein [Patulibacter minatonensis]
MTPRSAAAAPPLPPRPALLRASTRLAAVDGLTAWALEAEASAVARRAALARDAERLAAPRIWPDTVGSLATTTWRVARAAAPDAPLALLSAAAAATGLPVAPPGGGDGTIERADRLVRAGGPAYVKLGQFIASARGLLPDEWVDAFAWCRDEAPPMSPGVAEEVVRRELGDLDAFSSFESEPLAAGSIGQVHRAVLRDGTEVVVKVRRPGLRRAFRSDIETLALVCAAADRMHQGVRAANLPGFVTLFAQLTLEELDFRLEAANLVESVAVLEDLGADDVRVPRPFPALTTERLLVMELLPGVSYTRLPAAAVAGDAGARLFTAGVRGVLEATIVHGLFHGDLHAGNVLVEGDTFSMVDFGMCGRLDAPQRAGLVRFLLGFAASDARAQVEAMRTFGAIDEGADVEALVQSLQRDLSRLDARTDGQVTFDRLGETLGRLLRTLAAGGFRMPKELVLFFKNLLYLSGFAAAVAPDADVLAVVSGILADLFGRDGGALAAELLPAAPAAGATPGGPDA